RDSINSVCLMHRGACIASKPGSHKGWLASSHFDCIPRLALMGFYAPTAHSIDQTLICRSISVTFCNDHQ
ncbi:hypothetical protein, partial [Pseudomonas kitaguniensis]|uniref:hypothetical protein n=1 Tax=Pseudomonas kitaguniensis TaxID=2607908 RepID=UPI0019D69775